MKSRVPFLQTIISLGLIILLIISTIRPLPAQVIPIGQTFSADTIFQPFSGTVPVYSLHLYGSIQLYCDSSLVRVVLVDSYGNHLLVYESYPLITDTNSFSIVAGCDETCFLDGIIPDSLRIYIISSFCTIDSLKLDTNYITNAVELQAQARWNNDSVKIAVMNRRIQEEHMYWRAGRTNLSLLSFSGKEQKFGKRNYLFGYEFYKGGIYESPYVHIQPPSVSVFPNQFSWQDRHDANDPSSFYFDGDNNSTIDQRSGWLTPPRPQSPCQSCYAFSAVALVEAYANLYFNNGTFNPNPQVKHHIDLDLSELEAMRCCLNVQPCTTLLGGNGQTILTYIKNNYISDEACFPYSGASGDPPCSNKCQSPTEFVKISQFNILTSRDEEYIKEMLIKFGPISCFILNYPNGLGSYNHLLLLVGYKVAKVGDTVYIGNGLNDPPIILDSLCTFIGGTNWIFKDSDQNAFIQPAVNFNFLYTYDSHYLTGDIYRYRSGSETEIQCSDEDGDGYYWWGVHRDAQGDQIDPFLCNCPPGVIGDEEDCNDNDPNAGPYNLATFECTNIADSCLTSEDPLIIDENYLESRVWSKDMHIRRDIIIAGGNTLEVKGNVFFSPGAKIVVQPGGKLILSYHFKNNQIYPARLTSSCNNFWGGIELQGDPRALQNEFNQGTVEIDFGIIEHARCAVKTINYGAVPDGGGVPFEEGTPSGGIIRAEAAVFRNNLSGVEFLPFRFGSDFNLSYFKGCTFETTDALFGQIAPKQHLKVFGLNELSVKGCTFRNIREGNVLPEERGNGIYFYHSQLHLDTLHKLKGVVVNMQCNFDSLYYGIYAMSTCLGKSSLVVDSAVFNDNARSIYASGFTQINPVEVSGSFFNCDQPIVPDTDSIYMVYLNNSTGFKVHENECSGNLSQPQLQYGVIVNNSGTDNNYIYHNTFRQLTFGIHGLNINCNSDASIDGGVPVFIPTGLRFICNKFADVGCESDFLINENMNDPPTLPGIAYNQRNAANISNPTQEPAGNVFTQSHGNLNDTKFDINISATVGDILYTHHTIYPTGLRLIPNDVSNVDKVGYDPKYNLEYSEDESCPDDFYPEGDINDFRSAISQANHKTDSLITLLQNLVDEGSTDTLKSTVENSTTEQSYEVYQQLLNASPYLSDSVVKSSIEKEEVLPNAMIRDIMVANPQSAKSEDLLVSLDERSDPMPDSMWMEILQGLDVVGAMERLISELDGWIQNGDLYFNALADLYLADTLNEWAADSIISHYQNARHLANKYLLGQFYLHTFDYSQAGYVFQNIPSEFELTEMQSKTNQSYSSLIAVLPQLSIDSIGFLVPDSLQFTALNQIAETDYDIPSAWARNILISSGLINYNEPLVSGSVLKSSRKDKYHWTGSQSIDQQLKVFPNPARDYIIVEYKLNDNISPALIRILDLNGRTVKSAILKKNENQQIISIVDLISGTYLVQLSRKGIPISSQRVLIIR